MEVYVQDFTRLHPGVTIDLRHFSGNLLDTIAGLEPDLVLTLYTAGTTSNSALFQFEATE